MGTGSLTCSFRGHPSVWHSDARDSGGVAIGPSDSARGESAAVFTLMARRHGWPSSEFTSSGDRLRFARHPRMRSHQ